MYFIKTPSLFKSIFPSALWSVDTNEKVVYLTFDDGPTPEITAWVLEQLKKYNALATFFVLGKNVQRFPEIFNDIVTAKHFIGNHSFHHLNGWETPDEIYYDDIEKCSLILQQKPDKKKPALFRPPYGRISFAQYHHLKKHYQIVMWDVLSGDFDHRLSGVQCFENCRKHAQSGSILVFHDSHKGFERLKICLPLVLDYFSHQGYAFKALN